MQSQYVFYRQRMVRINFYFRIIVTKNVCDTTFSTYEISNSILKSMISYRANQC